MQQLLRKGRDQELGRIVAVKRKALLAMLTTEEQKTTKRHGSTSPETFEEKAQHLVDDGGPRAAFIGRALREFQDAVNALWVHAIQERVPEALATAWRRKHRGYDWISNEDLQAEAIFQLRFFVVRYDPDAGDASLWTYSQRGLHQRLTEWAAQQGPVELPQPVARKMGPDVYRRPIVHDGEAANARNPQHDKPCRRTDLATDACGGSGLNRDIAGMAYDPWDVIAAWIDGEITQDDL
jgi:hypothetical protein